MKKILKNKRTVIIIASAIALVVALGGYALSYYFYHQNKILKQNPNQILQEQAVKVTNQVSKLMQLPDDESPSVVTVDDKSKVIDQPFFKNAENGDVLLVYSKNLQAILYRPSANKIIQVGPVYNDNTVEQAQAQTVDSQVPLTIAIYNGSGVIGATHSPLNQIKEKMPVNVVSQTNASSTEYQRTLVVDVSGTHTDEVAQIAELLNATVSVLPPGETKPLADILVIVGRD